MRWEKKIHSILKQAPLRTKCSSSSAGQPSCHPRQFFSSAFDVSATVSKGISCCSFSVKTDTSVFLISESFSDSTGVFSKSAKRFRFDFVFCSSSSSGGYKSHIKQLKSQHPARIYPRVRATYPDPHEMKVGLIAAASCPVFSSNKTSARYRTETNRMSRTAVSSSARITNRMILMTFKIISNIWITRSTLSEKKGVHIIPAGLFLYAPQMIRPAASAASSKSAAIPLIRRRSCLQ